MYDLKTFAQMNLDLIFGEFPRLPELGEEVAAQHFDMMLGGGPMVYPLVLDKMGCKVRLGTFLSNNRASGLCRQLMAERGFSSYESFATPEPDPVVVTSVLTEEKDRRFVAFNRGVHESCLPEQTVYDFLSDTRVASAPVGHPRVTRALYEKGVKLICDVGWMDCKPLAEMEETLRHVSVFTPNDKEALFITGEGSVEDALRVLAEHTERAVITLGSGGAIYYENGVRFLPKLPGSVCVDTTGAGDNFMSGVIYGLCRDLPLSECVSYGNVFAGLSVGEYGCYGASITPEIVESRRRAYEEAEAEA